MNSKIVGAVTFWCVIVTNENKVPTSWNFFISFKMVVSEHPLLLRSGVNFSIDKWIWHVSSTWECTINGSEKVNISIYHNSSKRRCLRYCPGHGSTFWFRINIFYRSPESLKWSWILTIGSINSSNIVELYFLWKSSKSKNLSVKTNFNFKLIINSWCKKKCVSIRGELSWNIITWTSSTLCSVNIIKGLLICSPVSIVCTFKVLDIITPSWRIWFGCQSCSNRCYYQLKNSFH